ncbi:MAG TPA: LURP-one-related family protein [Thermoanaerobaculia bacterium]|nr:LURP-one-related family protein [Thermoanaerobaculia bacterium]
MRYVMRQKLLSLGDDFTIKDDEGRDVFYVDGKVLSLGDKLIFKDGQGNEVARVTERLLSIGGTWEVSRDGRPYATVKKSLFSILHCKFTVDVPGPDDLEARGNLLDHEYTLTRDGQVVAEVSKKWFSWTDSYGVEVAEGEDDVLILACAVVIDMACHKDEKDHDH